MQLLSDRRCSRRSSSGSPPILRQSTSPRPGSRSRQQRRSGGDRERQHGRARRDLCRVCIPYAASLAPEAGSSVTGEILRTDYPTLFNLIGTLWERRPTPPSSGSRPPRARPGRGGHQLRLRWQQGTGGKVRAHNHGVSFETDINSRGNASADSIEATSTAGGRPRYTDYAGGHGHSVFVDIWGHLSLNNRRVWGTGWAGLNWIIRAASCRKEKEMASAFTWQTKAPPKPSIASIGAVLPGGTYGTNTTSWNPSLRTAFRWDRLRSPGQPGRDVRQGRTSTCRGATW